MKTEEKTKVVLKTFAFGELFINHEWDEINSILSFKVGSFWAPDPSLEIDLEKAVKDDLEAIKRIKIPKGKTVDYDKITIYRFYLTDGPKPSISIEYTIPAMDEGGEDPRLCRGFERGFDTPVGGRGIYHWIHETELKAFRVIFPEEDKLKIYW